MGDVAAVRQHIEDVVARIQADNKYHEAHSTGNDLLQKVETEVLREFLAVDNSEQSSSGFKTKTTVGVMFANGVIDNMVVGGPAYNSRQLDKGDVVVDIDGKMVTSDNLSQLLVGSDIAGTPVTITVKKGSKTGVKKTVTLLRMPSEDIADRRRLFELFTAMKARATLPRGRETMEGMIDNAIELWTRMTIADSERDAKARERVAAMQERSKRILAEAVQNDEVKKLLYLQRHDDALGLKASFDQLDDAAKQAQVETARLTLALKEAEGEIIDLRADNVKLKDTVQSLEDQLRDARAAVAKLEADAEGIMSEFDACRNKGMGDSKEIEKLKRELAMQESTIKKQHQEKSDLQAQIDQLTRTVTETKQKLSKAVTDAEVLS
jgi:DNA repair exonuclease SbcCD ATPase subunit